jgi:hypothetical protein
VKEPRILVRENNITDENLSSLNLKKLRRLGGSNEKIRDDRMTNFREMYTRSLIELQNL